MFFSCPRSRLRIWSRETDSAVPSRVARPFSTVRLNLVLTQGVPPDFCNGFHTHTYIYIYIYIYRQPPSGQSRVNWVTQYVPMWRSLPNVRWHRASSPQGSSSNGCCLFRCYHGPILCASLFQDPLLVCSGYSVLCDTESIGGNKILLSIRQNRRIRLCFTFLHETENELVISGSQKHIRVIKCR